MILISYDYYSGCFRFKSSGRSNHETSQDQLVRVGEHPQGDVEALTVLVHLAAIERGLAWAAYGCSRDFVVVLPQWAYNMPMKIANVAEFKNHLSAYLDAVANGEEVEVRKRNTPFVRVVPIRTWARNRTVLGCGQGTVVVKSDLIDPMIPPEDWDMLGDAPA